MPRTGDKIREIVVVGVRVVYKPAVCDHEVSGVDRRSVAAVPGDGSLAPCPLEGLDREPHVLRLFISAQAPVFAPSPAVGHEIVPGGLGHRRNLGVHLEGCRTGEHGRVTPYSSKSRAVSRCPPGFRIRKSILSGFLLSSGKG